jgi:hypothetical protein
MNPSPHPVPCVLTTAMAIVILTTEDGDQGRRSANRPVSEQVWSMFKYYCVCFRVIKTMAPSTDTTRISSMGMCKKVAYSVRNPT